MKMVKVMKAGITKSIQEKDLPQYISMGWKEVRDYSNPQMFKKI